MVQGRQNGRHANTGRRSRAHKQAEGSSRGDTRLPVLDTVPDGAQGTEGRDAKRVNGRSTGPAGEAKRAAPFFRPLVGRPSTARLIPLAVLVVLAILFVVWETALRRFFPTRSVGWHHALLTLWAGVVTAVACTTVWLVMYRQQRRLADTATRLTRLLESYHTTDAEPIRFENPQLARCWEILDCERTTCPMHGVTDERCWQVVALDDKACDRGAPDISIQKCHECKVYALSCPDSLTELGEGFNNLMYLLDWESQRVDRMRGQMIEKEKMVAIGQMAAGIAHEVGNPLSSISSIVQMVKRSEPAERVSEQLDLIETHIRRISTTVRQLVSLARPGTQRWELVDVAQTARDAVQLIGFDKRARNVEIDCAAPNGFPMTYALRGELQQVFINLGLNALDAMADGGKLSIRFAQRHRELTVQFSDTGSGIDEAIGQHIFEPFFTTKEAGRGTGLGLSVSYGIMRKHGGRIEYTTTLGHGTTFDVRIPIWDQPPDAHR